ncbi:DNA ligase D [Halalkalibacter akibai]
MLLSPATEYPIEKGWLYETKFDGFRCLLHWVEKEPQLISRNGNNLNAQFPEIISYCESIYHEIKSDLPLMFDGEMVYLTNNFQSDFTQIQLRGRMRTKNVIKDHAKRFPCHLAIFDLLLYKGQNFENKPFSYRKQKLQNLFTKLHLPISISYESQDRLQMIQAIEDGKSLWNLITTHNGEGMVAKRESSVWESGKRTSNWLKVKNYRYISVCLTKYDKGNGYFHGSVFKEDQLTEVVIFRHGLTDEEEQTLLTFFQQNGERTAPNIWQLQPSICVEVACIDFDGKQLREPKFHAFNFELEPADCTWHSLLRKMNPLPETINITHPDKPIWPNLDINKDQYLYYLQKAAPFLLPFLKERLLTVIRFPHGANAEQFYQKHCPDYAPTFVNTELVDDINYILCNDIETLLWLGNQLALEFHIPFQTRKSENPKEIVFDLDPPSVDEFSLAIEAALQMKAIFDQFDLQSFVKTSGGKGLQVYIPLPEQNYSYDETRVFTEFVCRFLCEQSPKWFTTERLKKNRGNRLYLDYIQHDEGKTIVSPYSPRGSALGQIATPLEWSEVTSQLTPAMFTIPAVINRLEKIGDPFQKLRSIKEQQAFGKVLNQLSELVAK